MPRFDVFAALADASPKQQDRVQDRAVIVRATERSTGAAVIVCDGVGAYEGSGVVAEAVADFASDYVRQSGIHEGIRHVAGAAAQEIDHDGSGATTLLGIGAEPSGRVGYCLVGNGMLMELAGAPVTAERVLVRWNLLALSHVSLLGGRPALSSFLPLSEDRELEVVLGSREDASSRPRLYLACSDGIGSDEDRLSGPTPDGRSWQEIPRPLVVLLEDLGHAWNDLMREPSPEPSLQRVLNDALQALLASGALEDDATVGAVLLRPAAHEQAENTTFETPDAEL
jgi:hypothetical protein